MIYEAVASRVIPGRSAGASEEVSDSGSPLVTGPMFTQAGLLKCLVPEPALEVRVCLGWRHLFPFFNILRCPRFRPSDRP